VTASSAKQPPEAGAAQQTADAFAAEAGRIFARRSPAVVVENRPLGSLVWLTVQVIGWPGARPGQFVMLQSATSACFLARPLSVAQQEGDLVSLLIAPVGSGTHELCSLNEGQFLWVLGPLGNGFDLDALTRGPGRLVVVGGGVGAAPFPLLLSTLAASAAADPAGPRPKEVVVLLGFRDAAQASGAAPIAEAAAALENAGIACPGEVVTENGSVGRPERVTDALWRQLLPGDRLAVCGPWAMAEAVARVCAAIPDVSVWFSLEAGMACGVGSCHGCVVSLTGGGKARVCREGPVFTGETLFARGVLTGGGAEA
jgi:dihydroorotate dehydrogenase electron transfer subunit